METRQWHIVREIDPATNTTELYLDGEKWCGEDFQGKEDGWMCQDSDGYYCEVHQGIYRDREQKYWSAQFNRDRARLEAAQDGYLAYGDSYKNEDYVESILDRSDGERS